MNTDIKNKLISQIRKIDNPEILEEVNRLLNTSVDEDIYITSEEQRSKISQAKEQISNGYTIDGENADQEIDEWLEK